MPVQIKTVGSDFCYNLFNLQIIYNIYIFTSEYAVTGKTAFNPKMLSLLLLNDWIFENRDSVFVKFQFVTRKYSALK